jgi:hypothetical protein
MNRPADSGSPLVSRTFAGWIASLAAFAAFFFGDFIFRFSQWGGLGPKPDHIRYLFITIPGLIIFIGLSRFFSRVPALVANVFFASFVSWRTWEFHQYDQIVSRADAARSYVAFEWTALCGIVLIFAVWLMYPKRSGNETSRQQHSIV